MNSFIAFISRNGSADEVRQLDDIKYLRRTNQMSAITFESAVLRLMRKIKMRTV